MGDEKGEERKGLLGPALFCAAALGFLLWVLQMPDATRSDSTKQKSSGLSDLDRSRAACVTIIRKRLNDPGSAEWGLMSDNFYGSWPASHIGGGIVEVRPTFRANNAFGAKILTHWICRVNVSDNRVTGMYVAEQ